MVVRTFSDVADIKRSVGEVLGTSPWVTITQSDIDVFAAVTRDEQWIHVDQARAAAGPYGTTIAHGYLVMSLLAYFSDQVYTIDNLESSINYGSNRVRFPCPVPVDSRVRGTITLVDAKDSPNGTQIVTEVVVELEGASRPCCVAEMVVLLARSSDG